MSSKYNFIISLFIATIFTSCSEPDSIFDLSEETHSLFNADSTKIEFPDHYAGKYTVISFIYTHCHDVCPIITANMKNIQSELKDTSNVHFVEITFDPERDTPSVLKRYKDLYRLNKQFSLLTGNTASIHALLDRLNIVAEKTQVEGQSADSSNYMMKHSNTIYLMDPKGRIRFEYPASVTPPEYVAEDVESLR